MSNEPPSRDHSPEPSSFAAVMAELKSQSERLQQLVQRLEAQSHQDVQALAAAQAELNEYRQLLYTWAREQVREEDWQAFTEEEYRIPAEEAITELERQERA